MLPEAPMTIEQIIALIQSGGAPLAVVFAYLYWKENAAHEKTRAQLIKSLDNTDKIATALEKLTGVSGGLQ